MAKNRELFDRACDVFEARLTRAIPKIVEEFPFQATMLTAIAIDVLADTMVRDGAASSAEYIETIEKYLPAYKDYARRFYRTVRCGLVHRCQLTDVKRDGDKDDDVEGPSALSDGDQPPRIKSDKLVVDVKHLVKSFFEAYAEFKKDPTGPRQHNLTERMKQTVYDETPNGLVPQNAGVDPDDRVKPEDRALLELIDHIRKA